jgi:hypothetical protein
MPETIEDIGDALDEVDARRAALLATAPPWPSHYVGPSRFSQRWDVIEMNGEHEMHRMMYYGVKTAQWMKAERSLKGKVKSDFRSVRDQWLAYSLACDRTDLLRANPEFSTARERIDAQVCEEAALSLWRLMKGNASTAAQLRPRVPNQVTAYPPRRAKEIHL